MSRQSVQTASFYARDALALLGAGIRVARLEQRLAMAEVAERAGISRALLRRIERGDPGVSIGAAFEVAAVVGVPLFEVESSRLASRLAQQREKLALLPSAARSRRLESTQDDF